MPSLFAAALALLSSLAGTARSQEPEPLAATLLTRDLGDPRAPGNVKVSLTLPPSLTHMAPAATADDFLVYVYPSRLDEAAGTDERYRARALYLWRSGDRLFIDSREAPTQEEEGPATVKVVYAPGGAALSEGIAEGVTRYAGELADVILAVDISRSMLYNDRNKLRVAAARNFIDMARMGGGVGRVGLVTFNHAAQLISPLKPLEQGEELLHALSRIGADGLTSLDAPLRMSLKQFEETGSVRRPVVILLTDGKNEGARYRDAHLQCAEAGVRIFSVGLSESADHELLEKMADDTDGIYFRAPRDSDLPEIYARLAAELGKRRLLHAELLKSEAGVMDIPLDFTIRRFVVVSDAGAKVTATGPDGVSAYGAGLGSLFMVSPAAGRWFFAWTGADPFVSAMALFGETSFFLDVFPPQLRGDHLAVGATLARGDLPLSHAEVWLESIPGIIDRPIRLYDDGGHGDGMPGDGVYGALETVPGAPDRFDVVLRASGAAWDEGEFVRQAIGLVVRSREPPPEPVFEEPPVVPEPEIITPLPEPKSTASLEGDVDFGVLFPGETGTALATVELDAPGPRDLSFDLKWKSAGGYWPDLASRVGVDPGLRSFELEIQVPHDVEPGVYDGVFSVTDGAELSDDTPARVRVGTVRFDGAEPIDMGVVPPGTFASRRVALLVRADKEAWLDVEVSGDEDLDLEYSAGMLDAGETALSLEPIVSVPLNKPLGEYSALVRLSAGPGAVELPVRWRVEPYSLPAAAATPPPEGLPVPPSLPGDGEAPPIAFEFPELADNPVGVDDLFSPRSGAGTEPVGAGSRMGVSPWNRASRILPGEPEMRELTAPRGMPASTVDFPGITVSPDDDGESFWSAWWVYLLAALLLLLLLLLLLAYILYRLGKSSLARLLLASALANLILLAIFIALLSTITAVPPRRPPTMTISLVEYEPQAELTESEKAMLAGPSSEGESGGGETAAAGEIAFDGQLAGVAESELERESSLPETSGEAARIAEAAQASAAPLERSEEKSLARRARRTPRSEAEQPANSLSEIREMGEPPPETFRETGNPAGETTETGEARLELAATLPSDLPVWSDGERLAQPLASAEGVLLAEAGAEAVSLDRSARRIEPTGRRRNVRENPASYPEPRVEIDDPARDAVETAAASEELIGEPGVEELRAQPRSMGTGRFGGKPGAIVEAGASPLVSASPERIASGLSGEDGAEPALSRGGTRTSRGGAARRGASEPASSTAVPGAIDGERTETGAPAGGGRASGAAVGEKRFDAGPSGGDSGGADGALAEKRAPAGGGQGAPSRLAGDGKKDGVAATRPGGGATTGRRGPDRRGERRDGGLPGSRDGLPGAPGGDGVSPVPGGAGSGNPASGGSGGARPGPGRGTGEGRFDEMAAAGRDAGRRGPGISGLSGIGRSRLDGDGVGGGLGVVPLTVEEGEWRRSERRGRRRTANAAASSLDMDSLLIVVGDFSRLPDSASENIFAALRKRIAKGLTVEERFLTPDDPALSSVLLAVLSPEESVDWSDEAVANVARYLREGGHIWMDGENRSRTDAFMRRLAGAAGGEYGPLDANHQLSQGETVDALTIDGKLAAVATYRDWRKDWRFTESGNALALRFLVRGLNYFLSGNADAGVVMEPEALAQGVRVQPASEVMPERLAGDASSAGGVWDDFGPATAASWRMPSWSDPGRISAISDGEGGRALKLDLEQSAKGRAAVYRVLNPPEDFSRVAGMTVEVFYEGAGGAAVSMVFTLPAAGTWSDFESPPHLLMPGWNRLTFDLRAEDFRPLTPGAGSGGRLPKADRMGRAGFFLYRADAAPAMALFRDMRLHDDE